MASGDISNASPTPCTDYIENSHFTAPEIFGHRSVSSTPHPQGGAADIWALGMTCLELIGQTDVFDLPLFEAIEELQSAGPTFTDATSVDFRTFISECLELDPEARPSSGQLLEV